MSVFDRVRSACAKVAREARFVEIDRSALLSLTHRLAECDRRTEAPDPAQYRLEDDEATLSFVLCLDAINFGSGWFPELHKREGLSGYLSLASALRDHFESGEVFDASTLCAMTEVDCARILEQPSPTPAIGELMQYFARAFNDLGDLLQRRFGGSFFALVESAQERSAKLVECLAEMPLYQDRAEYHGGEVPFYKRAQITCADLAMAFENQGPGAFHDLDQLTLFADNLVPHVLRMEGVLVYDPDLLARINAGDLIPVGSEEEVEIRAVALHAVESMSREMAGAKGALLPYQIDHWLWDHGQSKTIKASPRHRTRCSFY